MLWYCTLWYSKIFIFGHFFHFSGVRASYPDDERLHLRRLQHLQPLCIETNDVKSAQNSPSIRSTWSDLLDRKDSIGSFHSDSGSAAWVYIHKDLFPQQFSHRIAKADNRRNLKKNPSRQEVYINASFTSAHFHCVFLLRRKFASVNGPHFLTHFPRRDI